ncbi:CRTAC1 family protein [Ottowia sp.]|uniref:CRTAC1 family protein n=1 Tax=Ottowia sp. TaxID=1898956 RepID=UPI0025EBFB38|nr:CRTAC1 family protein [Ottowia sp.]MBK6616075.1 CRTAC1 family protein [Ottowia sp.]
MIRNWSLAFGLAVVALSAWPASPDAETVVPKFVEESAAAGLEIRYEDDGEFMVGGGLASFDCDRDGLPELVMAGGVNTSKFFKNTGVRGGPLRFVETRSGLEMAGVSGAYPLDIDGDGLVDLVLLRVGAIEVFRGQAGCKFERVTDAWNLHSGNAWHTSFSATWEKGQSWPTLAVGTYIDRDRRTFPWGHCTPGLLFRPNPQGSGYLAPIELKPGHCALSMLFYDWSGKGTTALRVSNDRDYFKGGKEQLWQLTPGAPPRGLDEADGWKSLQLWGMGIAVRDLDGDGAPEVFLTSMADNKLQTLDSGTSRPSFKDIAFAAGVSAHRPYVGGDVRPSTAWHAQFEDFNNDGSVDLFIAKGNVEGKHFAMLDPNNLLLQVRPMHFAEFGDKAGIGSVKEGRGAIVADLNMDGLLDIVVVNRNERAEMWRQLPFDAPSKRLTNWVQLRLQQAGGNVWGVGSMLEFESGGVLQRREVTVGGGHASGAMGWTHFGMGKATAGRVRVRWPDGDTGSWMPVKSGEFLVVDRAKGVVAFAAKGVSK